MSERTPTTKWELTTVWEDVQNFASERFGTEAVRFGCYQARSEANVFPVLRRTGTIEASTQVSSVITSVPDIEIGLVLTPPGIRQEAVKAIEDFLQLRTIEVTKAD